MGGSYPDPFTSIITEIQTLVSGEIPEFGAEGRLIFRSLAVIVFAWWGLQTALEAADGGEGFSMNGFLKMVLFVAFGYCIAHFYATPIPGYGLSFTDIIRKEATWMSQAIGNQTAKEVMDRITEVQVGLGNPNPFDFHATLCYFVVFIVLAMVQAAVFIVVGYGFAAQAILFLIGPVLVPFFIAPRLDWIFWGWLRSFLQYSFYQVVAQGFVYVFGRVLLRALAIDVGGLTPEQYMFRLPIYIGFCGMMIYALFKVDRLSGEMFGGGSGSSGGSSGLAMQAMAAAAGGRR